MVTQTDNNHLLNRWFGGSIRINWEVAAYIVIILLAIFTRFFILGDRVMSHDESLHTKFSHDLYERGDFEHTPLMHGPILFHATALSYTLFGAGDFSARIYTAFLGVLLVVSPLLFRRWLGKWGALLASLMLLISPIILYYNRYIRHDTPSILAALIMIWAIMMYLNGPPNQQRRAHWLYIIAGSMIWNLGSKETAFIYIAIIGIFLAIYWFVRLAQHYLGIAGKRVFNTLMIGISLGGVMSMGMYIILDIIQFDLFPEVPEETFSALTVADQQTLIVWTLYVALFGVFVIFSTLLFAYRRMLHRINFTDVLSVLGISFLTCTVLVIIEEISHTTHPDEVAEIVESTISWTPMILVWVAAVLVIGFVVYTRFIAVDAGDDEAESDEKGKGGPGFWEQMNRFPEFDLLIVIGTLILPWATAFVPYLMQPSPTDLEAVGNALPQGIFGFITTYFPQVAGAQMVGNILLHALAWLPMMIVAWVLGLVWNWKRWLIAWTIFHVIFAFFFTTVFTNIAGLASGMIYSLGYWLEQQGVRRGDQPQYYYLLIIMPIYEFLPVIGSIFAMFTGMGVFWNRRRTDDASKAELEEAVIRLESLDSQIASARDDMQGDDENAVVNVAGESLDELQRQRREAELAVDRLKGRREKERLTGIPFLLFFSWLGVLNLVGYSLAGEKMPWLATHLTLPLIFLSAWFFGRVISRIDGDTFRRQGWLMLALIATAFVALVQVILPLTAGTPPFSGTSTPALEVTYGWLAALGVFLGLVAVVIYFTRRTGWRHLWQMAVVGLFTVLSVVTFRAAWMASFINYDYATEFLVYAHAAPGVGITMDKLEEISLQTTDGYDVRVAWDDTVSWPFSWYMRNYDNDIFIGSNPNTQNLSDAVVIVVGTDKQSQIEPIIEDRYHRFEYIRMWWPMQDYFNLTTGRIANTFSGTPEAAQIRRGLFDIWWSRDYSTYANALNKDMSLNSWPMAGRMYVYVRKDVAAQVWSYGVGEGAVLNPLDEIENNQCNANWQPLQPVTLMQSPDGLVNPVGIALSPDGQLYVAEEFGHQLSVFETDGTFVETIGQQGDTEQTGLVFNRPNSVDIADDGTIFVADTWNFRIVILSPDGEIIHTFGQPGTFGYDAPAEPADAFWGPRAVAYDDDSQRIFVSDTGNKRIRVYEWDGETATWIDDISEGGSGIGQVDEPSGIAVHSDERLFVADTWNRRIAVFGIDGGFFENYRVRGWYQEQGNRPYVALDEDRGIMYVTDPDAGRVLVYTLDGDCVGSFGQKAADSASPTGYEIGVASSVTVDDDGFVYVVDNSTGRVLKFEPFPQTEPPASDDDTADSMNSSDVDADDSPDVDNLDE
jgi:uncharacterized protein (TIGR03663 family)